MRDDANHLKVKFCIDKGYNVYIKPYSTGFYKIAVAKKTRYKISDIPLQKANYFELIDGIVYSVKVGDSVYNVNPKANESKWWDGVNELYYTIYERIIKNEK